jgi:hypothetical protein
MNIGIGFEVGGIMKSAKIFFIVISILLFIILFSCGQGTNNADQNAGELKYLNTVYGGCNNTSRSTIEAFVSDSGSDTVFYSVSGDILKISIGQNYVCCAPFELRQQQENHNLLITMYDTCRPDSGCYCKCPCYYEFEVFFSGYDHETYYLKVYLHDPRQAADSLMHEIVIEG